MLSFKQKLLILLTTLFYLPTVSSAQFEKLDSIFMHLDTSFMQTNYLYDKQMIELKKENEKLKSEINNIKEGVK